MFYRSITIANLFFKMDSDDFFRDEISKQFTLTAGRFFQYNNNSAVNIENEQQLLFIFDTPEACESNYL